MSILTEAEVVAAGERIARRLAEFDGYIFINENMRHSSNPRAKMYWSRAVVALDAYNGTDLDEAVCTVESELAEAS